LSFTPRILIVDITNHQQISLKDNIIKEKSFHFALAIIQTYKVLVYKKKEYVLSKQLLKSGTSIGAMIREAEHAQSKLDFIHKLSIAQKECNEVLYWIDLLKQSEFLGQDNFDDLKFSGIELMKLLTSILRSAKKNLQTRSLSGTN
jgi:four helix bundle protein